MKALFVMDMQEICVGESHHNFFCYENESLMQSVNEVINNNSENCVVYIKNLMKKNLISNLAPFKAYKGMKEVELASGLKVISENVFEKYKGNAFSNSKLQTFLNEKGIDEIELIGVDGGGCVSLTALGAIANGYRVILNTYAIGTMFDKKRNKYYQILKRKGAIFTASPCRSKM